LLFLRLGNVAVPPVDGDAVVAEQRGEPFVLVVDERLQGCDIDGRDACRGWFLHDG
jgi:hypothetical protein